MRDRLSVIVTIALSVCLLGAASPALGGTICLEWDRLPEASGYRVYYGTSPGQYGASIDVGGATRFDIESLDDCRTYFVAVKAYNQAGESISFSNEVSGWPRPEISDYQPGAFAQGSQITVDLLGANFEQGAELIVDLSSLPTDLSGDPLLRLEDISVLSCNRIQALMTVEPTTRGLRAMEVGEFAVGLEVRNPDSVFGLSSNTLEVLFDSERADINRSNSETRDRVDGKDLAWLAYAHGASEGDSYFNADADLDGDGQVDGVDLAWLASRFGLCLDNGEWSASACP
jgi:hypothetical protein